MKHIPSLLAALVSAGMLAGGIPAAASTAGARVGSLEAIDGGVSINRSPVQKQTGLPVLGRNDVLETTDGHAEMILTPGVFLRLGKDSQARLLNDSITDTRIGLLQGSAILEVDELHKDNHLQVTVADASALVLKTGLYRFDTQPASVEVIKGKAEVQGEDPAWSPKDTGASPSPPNSPRASSAKKQTTTWPAGRACAPSMNRKRASRPPNTSTTWAGDGDTPTGSGTRGSERGPGFRVADTS